MCAFAKDVEPVAGGDHIAWFSIIEVAIDVVDDDGIQIDEEGHAFEAEGVLAPERDLWPLAWYIRGDFAAEGRQGHAIHFRADAGGIIREAEDAEVAGDMPRDHGVQDVHILGAICGSPFDADDIFQNGKIGELCWRDPTSGCAFLKGI